MRVGKVELIALYCFSDLHSSPFVVGRYISNTVIALVLAPRHA